MTEESRDDFEESRDDRKLVTDNLCALGTEIGRGGGGGGEAKGMLRGVRVWFLIVLGKEIVHTGLCNHRRLAKWFR